MLRGMNLVAVVLAICFAARAGRADGWTTLASMPAPKLLHGAATGRDGLIYAFGGTANDSPPVTATVFAYDFNTDNWTAAAPLAAGPRRNFGYASDVNGVYYIGGYFRSRKSRRQLFSLTM